MRRAYFIDVFNLAHADGSPWDIPDQVRKMIREIIVMDRLSPKAFDRAVPM